MIWVMELAPREEVTQLNPAPGVNLREWSRKLDGGGPTGAVPLLDSTTSAVKTGEITGTPVPTLAIGAAVAAAARRMTECIMVKRELRPKLETR